MLLTHLIAHLEDAVSKGGDDAANGAGKEGAVGLKHQVGNSTDGHATAQRGVLDVDNFKPLPAETKNRIMKNMAILLSQLILHEYYQFSKSDFFS